MIWIIHDQNIGRNQAFQMKTLRFSFWIEGLINLLSYSSLFQSPHLCGLSITSTVAHFTHLSDYEDISSSLQLVTLACDTSIASYLGETTTKWDIYDYLLLPSRLKLPHSPKLSKILGFRTLKIQPQNCLPPQMMPPLNTPIPSQKNSLPISSR